MLIALNFADHGSSFVPALLRPGDTPERVSLVDSDHQERHLEAGWVRVHRTGQRAGLHGSGALPALVNANVQDGATEPGLHG